MGGVRASAHPGLSETKIPSLWHNFNISGCKYGCTVTSISVSTRDPRSSTVVQLCFPPLGGVLGGATFPLFLVFCCVVLLGLLLWVVSRFTLSLCVVLLSFPPSLGWCCFSPLLLQRIEGREKGKTPSPPPRHKERGKMVMVMVATLTPPPRPKGCPLPLSKRAMC